MRGWLTVRHRFPSTVPQYAGVYVVYGPFRPVYVGQSNNLQRRLRWWRSVGQWQNASTVKVCFLENVNERLVLEARLIRRLKPTQNHQHTGRTRPHFMRWIGASR